MPKEKEHIDPLFAEFPPVTPEQWMEQVKAELKGEPLEKLYWKTAGDIVVKPFYTEEDITSLPSHEAVKSAGWEIRQDIHVANEVQANQMALEALNGGINAIGFILNPGTDLRKLLENIQVEHISTHFMEAMNSYRLLDDFAEILEERGLSANDIKGSFSVELLEGVEEEMDRNEVADYFREFSELLPSFRSIDIKIKPNIDRAEALGLALAKAHEYLFLLTKGGIQIEEILPRLQFSLDVSTDFFLEIATLRAIRLLWPKVTAAYTKQAPSLFIHGANQHGKSTGPYINMAHTTTQCMAAIIGGCNSISINIPQSLERLTFLQHIARNTQLILEHEARLDKVADPAAGSYYVESLTDQLATKAWEHFKTIEAEGGYFLKYCMFL